MPNLQIVEIFLAHQDPFVQDPDHFNPNVYAFAMFWSLEGGTSQMPAPFVLVPKREGGGSATFYHFPMHIDFNCGLLNQRQLLRFEFLIKAVEA